MTVTTDPIEALTRLAVDLTRGISRDDRYASILRIVAAAYPCDAIALLRLGVGTLEPLAALGLGSDILGRQFDPLREPRFSAILASRSPVVFDADDPRPDPYNGLIEGVDFAVNDVHSCMGVTLALGDEVVGVLTLDAVAPGAFDTSDHRLFSAVGALVAAAMQTAQLLDETEQRVRSSTEVVRAMVAEALRTQGGTLLGTTDVIQNLRDEILIVATTDLTVLVTGETGTGKELVARTLHDRSHRSQHPLVYVNCAALPETLAESELFGHERGAFTGASARRIGRFELADGGTLFLDEVGELPLAIQAKLLRVLQFGEVQRVGSEKTLNVDVRVVAATNRDLEREVREGRFRADLYHRLNVYPVQVPPLRQRRDDVPLLAGRFLDRARQRLGCGPLRRDPAAVADLVAWDWPGNVRELDHVVTRAALRAAAVAQVDGAVVTREMLDLPRASEWVPALYRAPPLVASSEGAAITSGVVTTDGQVTTLAEAVDVFKTRVIQAAVDRAGGNWAAAARELGIHRSNLHHTAQRLGLK